LGGIPTQRPLLGPRIYPERTRFQVLRLLRSRSQPRRLGSGYEESGMTWRTRFL